ncbi:MAG: putative bifunctional diguanylate cyclase/phosphodiesterase, partial [Leptothrix sp. (in: b-proteobacteria)]
MRPITTPADHAPEASASEAFSKATLDALSALIGVIDRDGTVLMVNRAWRDDATINVGHPEPLREGENFLASCDRASGPAARTAHALAAGVRQVLAGQSTRFSIEYQRNVRVGGRWFRATVTPVAEHPGLCVMACADITARKSAERALQRQAVQHGLLARFGQFALENPPLHELMTLANDTVREGLDVELCRLLESGPDERSLIQVAASGWNEPWRTERCFDATAETQDRFILGARESIVIDDFEADDHFERSGILKAHDVRSAAEVLISGRSGLYGVIGAYAREPGRFSLESARFMQTVASTLAVAIERKQAEDRLAYLAQFDTLTSLPNRALCLDRLGHMLIEAERDRQPVGVLFIDIDRFKPVNDTLGHAIGDALLIQIAGRLTAAVRSADTVGRLGGDEFAVALALSHADDAGMVAQKIVTALATPFTLGPHQVYVSASIGISVFPGDGRDADTLLKNADTAMYRAKEAGRNTCQFFMPQMHERAMARLRLEARLRGALERGEFLLHYQPKADLRSGRISGMEALLRWQPDGQPLVSPADFIPILEDTGLIIPVGEWVVAEACTQIRRWQADGIEPPPVAINLSARQFRQKRLAEVLGDLIEASGVAPDRLEFELTESILMDDSKAAVQALHDLKARGIRLSVDDFGTGYSSLAYLKRFAVDALKI